jgi:Flp pilus assembly protein TadG
LILKAYWPITAMLIMIVQIVKLEGPRKGRRAMRLRIGLLSLLSRLGKHKHTSSPRLLARLLRDEEGSYLIYFAIAFPIFIGFAGLSTEGSLLFYNHRNLQSAADAAAYSAAVAYSLDTSANITTQAKAVVGSYGYVLGTSAEQVDVPTPTVINNYAGSGYTAIQVTASRPQTRFFSSLWISDLQPVGASATAIISGATGGGGGQCAISLAPTGAPSPPNQGAGITVQGTSTITAPNCGVFSNSSASNAIFMGGSSSSIIAGSIGAVGGVTISGSPTTNPTPTTGDGGMTDPYAHVYTGANFPIPGSCLTPPVTKGTGNTNLVVPASSFPPGTYCTNIDIKNADVTLGPGTYIFKNANLIVDTGSSLTGTGVTLAFTDPGGSSYPPPNKDMALNVSSTATFNLTAPAPDATLGIPGMLIIGDTNMPTTTEFDLWAHSGSSMSGVVYVPNGNFGWGGAPILAGGCTQMIAFTLNLQGNATFDNAGCNFGPSAGASGGPGGPKPIGSVVTLVR